MNELQGAFQAVSILFAIAASWACHRAGKSAPTPRALAWHSLSVVVLLRAINSTARMYAPEWRPIELYATPLLLTLTAIALAMLARSFVIPERQARAKELNHGK